MVKLSAICCNYNHSRYAIEWLRKVAKAGYDEIIVVDDCSTDGSYEVFEALKQCCDFKLIRNDKKGLWNATMRGVAEAQGEFVIFLAMDDFPEEDHGVNLKKRINLFPHVDIIFYACDVLKEGNIFKRGLMDKDAYISYEYFTKIIKNGFGSKMPMTAPAVRKANVIKCWEGGGEDLKVNFDLMYNLYSIYKTGFTWMGRSMYTYRSNPQGFGHSGKIRDIKLANKIIDDFMWENLPDDRYWLFEESGICSDKELFKVQASVFLLKLLPKWIKHFIYYAVYNPDERIENL